VPVELSSLAVRTIEDGDHGGIRTSSAILRVLDQVAEAEERTELIHAVGGDAPADEDGTIWTTKKPVKDAAKRRKLALGVTVLVVAAVGVLAWVGMLLISFFQNDPTSTGPKLNVGAPPSSSQAAPPQQSTAPALAPTPAPATGQPVIPAGVSVYNPSGTGDSPSRAKNAIDGNPATVWRTDQYQQQFPALKAGVGLLVNFQRPINFSQVGIDGASAGTKVEIRVADSRNPQLNATRVVGSGDLSAPQTTISLQQPQQTQYVIVWITQLGTSGGTFVSQIGDLTFTAAG
jgi:hypothetical protein